MTYTRFLFFLYAVVFTGFAHASEFQQQKDFENYSIRYTVFNSTFVPADVARAYKIKRSAYESLLNVSIYRRGESGALPAKLSGTVKNLIQQQKPLNFTEIKEKNSTYYIAPISISGEEVVHISLTATPEGESEALTFEFAQRLYSDK